MSKYGKNPEAGDCVRCFCYDKKKSTSVAETQNQPHDHLKNWETWLNRRDAVHKRLEKLGRVSGDLLMNLGEDVRFINEERQLFSYTNIEDKFDKYRGNPAFWNLPLALPNKERPFYRNPTHFAIKTKEDQNIIPSIDYIATPDCIMKEKHIERGERNIKTLWQKGNYRTAVWFKKQMKIQHIQPHRPEHNELVIYGSKIELKPKEERRELSEKVNLPESQEQEQVTQTKESPRDSINSEVQIPKTKFKINNIEIFENCLIVQSGKRKIQVLLEYEIESVLPDVKYLQFENTGGTTVRFKWAQFEKFRLFRDFPRKNETPFYFNKSEFLLIPGQKKSIPVWFRIRKQGNYFEFWELTTVPKLWDAEFRLLICLQGFACIKNFTLKSEQVRNLINSKLRENIIKDIVYGLLDKLKYANLDQAACKFDEEQLFQSTNMTICITGKVPKYLYNKNVIKELRKFYLQVKRADHPVLWDMSIENLIKITREKDLLTFCERKMDDFIRARAKVLEMENKEKGKDRNDSTTMASVDYASHEETYFQKLQKLLQKLERPSMVKNTQREKYYLTYRIFCVIFEKLHQRLQRLDRRMKTSNFHLTPNIEADRMIFERFDDIWVSRIKRVMPETKMEFQALPKTSLLKNIPADDVKRIYKVYFNAADEDDKKGKKKVEEDKHKAEPNKKNKTDKEKSAKTKNEVADSLQNVIKEDLNPFCESFVHTRTVSKQPLSAMTSVETLASILTETSKTYYIKYIMIYSYLEEAIGTMVDCLETFKATSFNTDILNSLQVCKEATIFPRKESEQTLQSVEQAQETRHSKETLNLATRTRTSEENVYFEYLLRKHWKENNNTKKYIVEGKTITYSKMPDKEGPVLEPLVNVFTDPSDWMKVKSLEEFSTCESKCVQTSDADYELNISDILLTETENEMTISSSQLEETDKSTDMFYFLEDSIVEEESEKH